jgi:G:T-mismatch repair DNA endonuclease (very short patch repair protein)
LVKICSVKGCQNIHKGRGFCDKHLAKEVFTDSKLCTYDGCNNKHKGRGYCDKHLQRLRNHGDVNYIPDPKIKSAKLSKAGKGHPVSKQTRNKISERLKKAYTNPKLRKKQSESHKGQIVSEATRKKLSIINTGKKLSPETLKKMSIGLSGLKRSPQQRKNMSEGQTGKIFSKTHLKNLVISHTGHKDSEITRKRKSTSISKAYENPELRKKMSDIQSTPERKQLQRDVMRKVRHNQQKPNMKELKIKKILTDAGFVFNPEQDLNKFIKSSNGSNFGMFINVPFSHPKLQQKYKETDFLIPPNKIIEHNGTYIHADPRKYSANAKIWGKTAEQKWGEDKMILDSLKKEGHEILIVWELDLVKDTENTTKKILEFAKS